MSDTTCSSTKSSPEHTVTRRDFMRNVTASATLLAFGFAGCSDDNLVGDDGGNGGGGGGNGGSGGTGVVVNGSTITLDLTKSQASQVASAGGFLFISSGKTVVVNDGGTIRAFTSVCTHQQCDVSQFSGGRMVCPCHGSSFNLDGSVSGGPAPSALREFSTVRSGDTVTITKS